MTNRMTSIAEILSGCCPLDAELKPKLVLEAGRYSEGCLSRELPGGGELGAQRFQVVVDGRGVSLNVAGDEAEDRVVDFSVFRDGQGTSRSLSA